MEFTKMRFADTNVLGMIYDLGLLPNSKDITSELNSAKEEDIFLLTSCPSPKKFALIKGTMKRTKTNFPGLIKIINLVDKYNMLDYSNMVITEYPFNIVLSHKSPSGKITILNLNTSPLDAKDVYIKRLMKTGNKHVPEAIKIIESLYAE